MNRLLREALEFYANPENWKWVAKPTDTDFILDCGSEVQRDFGRIAREALNSNKDSGNGN